MTIESGAPEPNGPRAPDSPGQSRRLRIALAVAAFGVPAIVAAILAILPARSLPLRPSPVSHFPPASLAFAPRPVGPTGGARPRIANVRAADLDRDGRAELLACDAERNRVFQYRLLPNGDWDERPLGPELPAPAAATPVDLDGDGDLDLVVAVLGSVLPTDDRIGQVVWLENRAGEFHARVLLDRVRRVSDVQAADFDGDGDVDLVAAVFGYHHGEILHLENRGGGRFRDHLLLATDGPSHVPVADFTGDGKPDIAALVSQDHEEVWLFANAGGGRFEPRRIFHSPNFDLGTVGLVAADINGDAKMDLLLVAGDNLEVNHHYPQPWHGLLWLENRGSDAFETRRLASVGGAYAAAVADFDGDGDLDIAVACMFNDWHRSGSASLVLLTNDGARNFTATSLATEPTHLATVAAGDWNGDGRPDLAAGCLHLDTPTPERAARLVAWLQPEGKR